MDKETVEKSMEQWNWKFTYGDKNLTVYSEDMVGTENEDKIREIFLKVKNIFDIAKEVMDVRTDVGTDVRTDVRTDVEKTYNELGHEAVCAATANNFSEYTTLACKAWEKVVSEDQGKVLKAKFKGIEESLNGTQKSAINIAIAEARQRVQKNGL
jgi:hypothetical protein